MPAPARPPLARRIGAELIGSAWLAVVVVGSGIAAQRLSPTDVGLQLAENAVATAAGLAVIILAVGPVSGAHLNPVISLADAWLGRPAGTGLTRRQLAAYLPVQVLGCAVGTVLANLMFARPAVTLSQHHRSSPHLLLAEVVATAGLLVVVFALARSGRAGAAPAAVGAYIGSAYFFTSSTSFANPAITVGRALSNTFAGIAPASVPGFVAAQLVGLLLGVALVRLLYPDAAPAAGHVVVPPLDPAEQTPDRSTR